MIEKETMYTVIGVVLLGVTYGFNVSYVMTPESGFGSAFPIAFNLVLLVYVMYGLRSVNKLPFYVEAIIVSMMIFLLFAEGYLMTEKPYINYTYGPQSVIGLLTLAAIFRLYFLVSLNCDFAKSYFVQVVKQIADQPRASVVVPVSDQVNLDRAYTYFDNILRKSNLSDDEKLEAKNKFKLSIGRVPKDVVMTGGKR
jgi:hypothetical protein